MSLKFTKDRYNGRAIDPTPDQAALAPPEFAARLSSLLAEWKTQGVRGVWLKLPQSAAALVPVAVEQGFQFHHARPGYLQLTLWLPGGESRLPEYPHHQIGVAGMVLSPDGSRVLAIQEKTGVTAGRKDFWKLPGGLVDSGEDIKTAVEREVEEETGIVADFVSIATFRETHQGPFGCTDLYLVCVLRLPEGTKELPEPVPEEQEIARAEWRPLDRFLSLPMYKKGLYGELLRKAAEVATQQARGGRVAGLQEQKLPSFSNKVESLYYTDNTSQGVPRTTARL
eukprot:Hpha_TRINITY_DN15422_c0_g2::TRINITY_DN15422_c0_g2_i1::g.176800::m.176800